MSSLYILEISLLSDVGLVKIFSHSVGCLFYLIDSVFCFTETSVSGGPFYLLVLSMAVLLGLYLGSGLLCPYIEDCFPLSLSQFLCGWIYIEIFNPFGLEFCAWVYFHSSTCWHPVIPAQFVEDSFFHCIILASLSKTRC